jgi:hypothetical protein
MVDYRRDTFTGQSSFSNWRLFSDSDFLRGPPARPETSRGSRDLADRAVLPHGGNRIGAIEFGF